MARQLALGIDLGTSSLKAVLLSLNGDMIGSATSSYPTFHPHTAWAEQSAEDWWNGARDAIRQVLSCMSADDSIVGISISSQAPTMLALDVNGDPLYPALIWFDKRADDEANWLREHVGNDAVSQLNGNKIDPYYAGVKMLWFKLNHPDLYGQTYKFLQASSYITYKLTGKYTIDLCHLPLTLLANMKERRWSLELCGGFGIDVEKLPDICLCTDVVGEVTLEASNETGLKAGIPVLAGGVDTPAAILGDGIFKPGQAYFSIGTGASIGLCTNRAIQEYRLMSLPHMVPETWILNGVMTSVGGSFRWFKDQLAGLEREASRLTGISAYEFLNQQAVSVEPGSGNLIFLPYMMGEQAPIWNPQARGVFFGLSLATTRAQMVRAVMEGCAYGLRHNLEVIAENGGDIGTIRVSGGPNRSEVWNQIWADVTGVVVEVPESSLGAPVGNAVSVMVGLGLCPSYEEILTSIARVRAVYQPRAEYRDLYSDLYACYRNIYQNLEDEFARLASIDAPC